MRALEQYDVVVVGAGPSGSAVSRWIAEEGSSVLLVEEHQQIGRPNHCAGLVTPRTLHVADLHRGSLVDNELRGAIIRSASGGETSIFSEEVQALAINRPLLDTRLAEEAQQAGARLVLGTRASHFERQGDKVRVRLDGTGKDIVVETRLLIAADGARSGVARWAGLAGPQEVIKAANAEVRLPNCASDFVEVFVGRSVAPGWFAWIIPLGDGHARLGIGTTEGSARRYLQKLIDAFPQRFRGVEILDVSSGLIPLGTPERICADNVMLVGDAACQVKPTSGGGIYTGLLAARSCARAAVRALRNGDLSAQSLGRYHTAWLNKMGGELELGIFFRRIFTRIGDDDFDRLLRVLKNQTVQRLISKHGDIDHPSLLFGQLLSAFPGLKALAALRLLKRDDWVRDVIAIMRRW